LLVADVAADEPDDTLAVVSDGDEDPLAVEVADRPAAGLLVGEPGVDQLVVAEPSRT
jgi:hypothetical protein